MVFELLKVDLSAFQMRYTRCIRVSPGSLNFETQRSTRLNGDLWEIWTVAFISMRHTKKKGQLCRKSLSTMSLQDQHVSARCALQDARASSAKHAEDARVFPGSLDGLLP